jgi:hypothetical protein
MARSIVQRAFADPVADVVAVAGGELLRTVRHADLRRHFMVEQPHQVAAVGILRDDHLAVLGALHHPLVAGEVEPALFKPVQAGRVAAGATSLEDRHDILGEAELRGGSRAGFADRQRHADTDGRRTRNDCGDADETLQPCCHFNASYPTSLPTSTTPTQIISSCPSVELI